MDPTKLPGEYAAIGHPQGPDGLEGHRHRGHRSGRRRDPRRRRRRRAGVGPGAPGARRSRFGGEPAGRSGATSALPTTRRRRRPSGVRRFPYPVRPGPGARPGAAGPRIGQAPRPPRRRHRSGPTPCRPLPARLLRLRGCSPSRARCPTRSSSRRARRRRAGRWRSSARRPATSRPQALMEQEVQAPGISRARGRLPGREPVRPDRSRPRLRLERDDLGAGHRRHVRGGPVRPRRHPAAMRRPLPDRGACVPMECSSARTRGSRPPQTRTPAGSETLRDPAHAPRARRRARHDPWPTCGVHTAARDVHARARLRPGLRLLQRPGPHQGPDATSSRRRP